MAGNSCRLCSIGFLYFAYYFSIKPGAYKRLYLPYGHFLLLIINTVWFVSGGCDSPNGYIPMIILIILIFVSRRKILPWIVIFFLLDIIVLFGIEYYNPDIVMQDPKQSDKISQGIVFIVCTLLMVYVILIVRQHYDREHEKPGKTNRELAGKNLEIAERNRKLKEQGELLVGKNNKITKQNGTLHN
jgi:hypothetical protein